MTEGHEFIARQLRRLDAQVTRHAERREYRAATDRSEEICRLLEQSLGEEHPAMLPRLSQLAELYQWSGDDRKAAASYSHTAALSRTIHGRDSLQYAAALNALGVFHCENDRPANALPLFERVLDLSRGLLPGGSPELATLLNNLANVHHSLGDFRSAEARYRETLSILEEQPPPCDDLGHCLSDLAEMEEDRGHRRGALRWADKARESFRKSLEENGTGTAYGLARIATFYCRVGDPGKALWLLREAVCFLRKNGNSCSPEFARSLGRLAELEGLSRRSPNLEDSRSE